jgi:hypothetical protein
MGSEGLGNPKSQLITEILHVGTLDLPDIGQTHRKIKKRPQRRAHVATKI